MTYRHHLARLQSHSEAEAVYTFTPDSVRQSHWGLVSFDLHTFAASILQFAPDPESPSDWQRSVCSALAYRLKKARAADPNSVPPILEFVA
jgi:hypothetical protein